MFITQNLMPKCELVTAPTDHRSCERSKGCIVLNLLMSEEISFLRPGKERREVKEMKIYGKTFSCSLRCVIVLLSFARHIKSGRESSLSKVSSQSYSIYISSVLRFMLSLTVYACALLLPAWIDELTSFELKHKQLSPVTEKRIVLHN